MTGMLHLPKLSVSNLRFIFVCVCVNIVEGGKQAKVRWD